MLWFLALFEVTNYQYTESSQKVTLLRGYYLFECWGAQGCTETTYDDNVGGKGAYTRGVIRVSTKKDFYLFIGSQGKCCVDVFNGGGKGQFSGGGATDIRLVDGNWDNFESLKSRIMVAAGGGGPDTAEYGGAGGCLDGINGNGEGGHQTSGGNGHASGSFGKGGSDSGVLCGGGGGGYYGGGSSKNSNDYSGGGGSSFISGYAGCKSISKDSTETNIVHLESEFHYSGNYFINPVMIDGNTQMPNNSSSLGSEIGHTGNGAIRITQVGPIERVTCAITYNKAAVPPLVALMVINHRF